MLRAMSPTRRLVGVAQPRLVGLLDSSRCMDVSGSRIMRFGVGDPATPKETDNQKIDGIEDPHCGRTIKSSGKFAPIWGRPHSFKCNDWQYRKYDTQPGLSEKGLKWPERVWHRVYKDLRILAQRQRTPDP